MNTFLENNNYHFNNINNDYYINYINDINNINNINNIINNDYNIYIQYINNNELNVDEELNISTKKKLNIYLLLKEYKNIDLEHKIECPICYEEIYENCCFTTNCNHKFCKNCIIKQFELSNISSCALCRTTITSIDIYHINDYDDLHDKFDLLF